MVHLVESCAGGVVCRVEVLSVVWVVHRGVDGVASGGSGVGPEVENPDHAYVAPM